MTAVLGVVGLAAVAGAVRVVERGRHEREELSAWAERLALENRSVSVDPGNDLPALDAPLHPVRCFPLVRFTGGEPRGDRCQGPPTTDMPLPWPEPPRKLGELLDRLNDPRFDMVTLAPSRSTRWSEIVETWNAFASVGHLRHAFAFGARSRVPAPSPSRMDAEIGRATSADTGTSEALDRLLDGLTNSRCPNPWLLPQSDLRRQNYDLSVWIFQCAPWTDFSSIRAVHWAIKGRWGDPLLISSTSQVLPATGARIPGEIAVAFPAATTWADIAADVIARVNAASGPVRLVVSEP